MMRDCSSNAPASLSKITHCRRAQRISRATEIDEAAKQEGLLPVFSLLLLLLLLHWLLLRRRVPFSTRAARARDRSHDHSVSGERLLNTNSRRAGLCGRNPRYNH